MYTQLCENGDINYFIRPIIVESNTIIFSYFFVEQKIRLCLSKNRIFSDIAKEMLIEHLDNIYYVYSKLK